MMVGRTDEELMDWFEKEVLPEIVRGGHLPVGDGPRIAGCRFEPTARCTDHFASSPFFLDLEIDSDRGREIRHLIVKFCSQNEEIYNMMMLDRQYRNEVIAYTKLFPSFRDFLLTNPKAPNDLIDQLIPRCYHARFDESNPMNSFLVFENRKMIGYKNAESPIFLDYEHCAVAMRQLGKFHALSLAVKIGHDKLNNQLIKLPVEHRYVDQPENREKLNLFHGITNHRGVDHLLSMDSPPVPKDYLLRLKKILSEPFDLFRRLIAPKEPLAIFCHGDFCRNNLLFRYENNRVVDAQMFDFQLLQYGSPSLDLAFFIYLNTDQQLRDKHFDELINIYHSSLISTAAAILDKPEVAIERDYPLKLFREDFAEHALYGYCLVAFFFAVMAVGTAIDWSLSIEEKAKALMKVGGSELSSKIADIIIDFYKRGFYVS